jgi:hypoxanthine phosphoribosyltransferase
LVTLKDKLFKPYISSEEILKAVKKVADKINSDLAGESPVFLAVLNGSFMFASDLMKEIRVDCEISFVKLASYHGTTSSGTVSELIGLSQELSGRTVVIVEDIVDTGNTLEKLEEILKAKKVKSMKVAAAFFKPSAYTKTIKVDYVGLEIPNDFVVGYGLDYDGLGRNLKDVYVLA